MAQTYGIVTIANGLSCTTVIACQSCSVPRPPRTSSKTKCYRLTKMTYRGAHFLSYYTPSTIQGYRHLNIEFVVGIRTLHLLGITFKLTASPYSLYPLSCKPCPTRYVILSYSQFLHMTIRYWLMLLLT